MPAIGPGEAVLYQATRKQPAIDPHIRIDPAAIFVPAQIVEGEPASGEEAGGEGRGLLGHCAFCRATGLVAAFGRVHAPHPNGETRQVRRQDCEVRDESIAIQDALDSPALGFRQCGLGHDQRLVDPEAAYQTEHPDERVADRFHINDIIT